MSPKSVSGAPVRAHPELVLFTGHSDDVTDLTFSPDGKILASCSYDRNIILWDVSSGSMIRKFSGHGEGLQRVSFSPCGSIVAGCDWDGIRLWEVKTGRLIRLVEAHILVGFLPDGRLLAGNVGGGFELLHLDQQGKVVARRNYPEDQIDYMVISDTVSPDGRLIAVSPYPGNEIYLHDVETGETATTLESPDLLPEDQWLLTFEDTVVNGSLPLEVQISEDGTPVIGELTFSPDCSFIASKGDHVVVLWDARSGACLQTIVTGPYNNEKIVFSEDASRLAVGTGDGDVAVYETQDWRLSLTISAHSSWTRALAFSPDVSVLATGGSDHTVRLWDANTGASLQSPVAHTVAATHVSLSDDGRSIRCTYSDERLRTWSASTGLLVSSETAPDVSHEPLAFSPDGSLELIDKGQWRSSKVAVFRSGTDEEIASPWSQVISAAFSPDGKLLAIGEWGFQVSLWDTQTWQQRGKIRLGRDDACAIAFSPDGNTIALGTSYDSAVQLFSVKTLREKRTLTEHTNRVESIAYSPDGQCLATASADGTVRLWSPRNGRLIVTLMVLPKPVNDESNEWIAYTPEGHYCGSRAAEEYVRWHTNGEVLSAEAFSAKFRHPDLSAYIRPGLLLTHRRRNPQPSAERLS